MIVSCDRFLEDTAQTNRAVSRCVELVMVASHCRFYQLES